MPHDDSHDQMVREHETPISPLIGKLVEIELPTVHIGKVVNIGTDPSSKRPRALVQLPKRFVYADIESLTLAEDGS